MQYAMKKPRSLKVDIPPAAELARARREILDRVKLHDQKPDKIKLLCATETEQQWAEEIVEQIAKRLREHRKSKQAQVAMHGAVVFACCSVEASKEATKPRDVEEIKTELVAAAQKLLRILGRPELPPNFRYRVFRSVDNWNWFIEHLEKLTTLTYRKPPRNFDPVKRACAIEAWLLITEYTVAVPTGTQGGLFRTIAGLLHQYVCSTADGATANLKGACDAVLKFVKAGGNLETERW